MQNNSPSLIKVKGKAGIADYICIHIYGKIFTLKWNNMYLHYICIYV